MAMEPLDPEDGVVPRSIEDEMRTSYIDYAMSVIVGRALPDVRDGLKPVHRRILYAMEDMGLTADNPHRKSARIVGEVLGKYHPHGDSAVYDTLVRMAQDFSLRYPLVDGMGNFGSVDGDSAAAMRYTEARLTPIAGELLEDIGEDTVDFVDNFDGSLQEPTVLPGKLPNLLLNGSSGIAVGMATNVPPHQLGEIVDGLTALIDDPELTNLDLMEHIPGPDFPTGGVIYGRNGIVEAYTTGRGSITMRARTHVEDRGEGRERIVVDEIPYMVNKSKLLEDIAGLVRDKKVTEIADLRDESDRDGMRIVIELKRDALPDVVLNQLFRHTQLQSTFGAGMLGIHDGEPKRLTLKQGLQRYLDHRAVVVRRRTQHRLDKAEARAHILEGLTVALDQLDDVIDLIRGSEDTGDAREGLQATFELSEEQAKAVLDMRLQRLTGLQMEKVRTELEELEGEIERYQEILGDPDEVREIIKRELQELKEEYDDERRTDIVEDEGELLIEDLIPDEGVVVMLTKDGYVKRMPVDEYRTQRRGGRGVRGMTTKEDDYIEDVLTTTAHKPVLVITDHGRVYGIKAYEIPEGSRQSRGRPIVNIIERLDPDVGIQALISVEEFVEDRYLFFATRNGTVKKTSLSEYERINIAGKYAIKLEEGDELIGVAVTEGDDDIILAKTSGKGVRFHESQVRPTGRNTIGVKGTELRGDEEVVSMVPLGDTEADLLTVTSHGKGKRTPISTYSTKNRGILGQYMHGVDEGTGPLVAALEVEGEEQLILTTRQGIVIRIAVDEVSRMATPQSRGVYIQRLAEDDEIMAVALLDPEDEEDLEPDAEDDGNGDGDEDGDGEES